MCAGTLSVIINKIRPLAAKDTMPVEQVGQIYADKDEMLIAMKVNRLLFANSSQP